MRVFALFNLSATKKRMKSKKWKLVSESLASPFPSCMVLFSDFILVLPTYYLSKFFSIFYEDFAVLSTIMKLLPCFCIVKVKVLEQYFSIWLYQDLIQKKNVRVKANFGSNKFRYADGRILQSKSQRYYITEDFFPN